MSKFYIIGKISRELAKRMQSDPNADRAAAIKAIRPIPIIPKVLPVTEFQIINLVKSGF